ncbi:hypothetical protein BH18ACI1_BH18ACI1_08430 [soil metagenome]
MKFAGNGRQFRELLFHFPVVRFDFAQIYAYLLNLGERHSTGCDGAATVAGGAQIKAFGKLVNLMRGLRRVYEPPQSIPGLVRFAAVIFAVRFHVSFTACRAFLYAPLF